MTCSEFKLVVDIHVLNLRLFAFLKKDDEAAAEISCSRFTSLRPGWARISFNYFYSDSLVDFIIKAVNFVATHGWKFVIFYEFDASTGLWTHKPSEYFKRVTGEELPRRKPGSLNDIDFSTGHLEYTSHHFLDDESALPCYLEKAFEYVKKIEEIAHEIPESFCPPFKGFADLPKD